MESKAAELLMKSRQGDNKLDWQSVRFVNHLVRISSFEDEPVVSLDEYPLIIISSDESLTNPVSSTSRLQLCVPRGKAGQITFMKVLPEVEAFSRTYLGVGKRISIASQGDCDYALGVGLVILAKFFDNNGAFGEASIKAGKHTTLPLTSN